MPVLVAVSDIVVHFYSSNCLGERSEVLSKNEFLKLVQASGSDLYPPDAEQAQAVYADPAADLFIVAGPGTGKTSCLTFRVLYLVLVAGLPPRSIMATSRLGQL